MHSLSLGWLWCLFWLPFLLTFLCSNPQRPLPISYVTSTTEHRCWQTSMSKIKTTILIIYRTKYIDVFCCGGVRRVKSRSSPPAHGGNLESNGACKTGQTKRRQPLSEAPEWKRGYAAGTNKSGPRRRVGRQFSCGVPGVR